MSGRSIEFREATFGYFRGATVVDHLHLTIGAGLTLVLGPNGAGKSTLMKLAAGVEKPDSGRVLVNGHDLWAEEVKARRDLAYVPEQPDVTPLASVNLVLRFVARLRGEAPERAEEALSGFGLRGLGERSIRELSKGQRHRVLLAAARIGAPRTILLDEPLAALDRETRGHVLAWVDEIRRADGLVVVVTHEIEPFLPMVSGVLAVAAGGAARVLTDLPTEPDARERLLERLARGEPAGETPGRG